MAECDDLTNKIPCEFCGDLVDFDEIIQHESGCRIDLVHYNVDEAYIIQESIRLAKEAENPNNASENIFNIPDDEEQFKPKQEYEQFLGAENVKAEPKKEYEQYQGAENVKDEPKKEYEQYQGAENVKDEEKFAEFTEQPQFSNREQFKEYKEAQTKFPRGKEELLLSYSSEYEKEAENVKEIYKIPEDLFMGKKEKKDIIDVSTLSDDDSSESLEEFWKRASDKLKCERNKRKSELAMSS